MSEEVLDYSKWSATRRSAKLSTDHALWLTEKEKFEARQRWENNEAKQRRLAQNEAKLKAKKAEDDAAFEQSIAPEKRRLQNEWLASHPDQTAADFEKKAWGLLKENIIEQQKKDSLNAEIQRLAASGRYSL